MKFLACIAALFATAVLVAPVLAQDASFPVAPNPVGPGNSGPDIYLAARYFDLGIDIAGSGSTINPSDVRPDFYAFTGEKIIYYVLVRDQNGVADINDVYWTHAGSEVTFCDNPVSVSGTGAKASFIGEDGKKVQIDTATNLQYDDQTDNVYRCQMEVEGGWQGVGIIDVEAVDMSNSSGQTLSEQWNFNPALSVSLDTDNGQALTFGDVILDQTVPGATKPNCVMVPNGGLESLTDRDCVDYTNLSNGQKLCDISFSENQLVITNTGITKLWPFIAAEDFHASGMAKCPFDNTLSANQFEYRALSGTLDSGWRMMPEYADDNLGCNGIDLGSSSPYDPIYGQCRGGCRIPTGTTNSDLGLPGLDVLNPGHAISVRFKIVWPTPCIGTFDDGEFYVIVRAV